MLWIMMLVGGGVLSLVLVPILGMKEPWDLDETPDRLRDLKRSRDRAMRTLKDLENDLREGSLAPDDYEELRGVYKRQAIELTRELDRVREVVIRQIKDDPERPLTQAERKVVEAHVGRRLKKLEGARK